MKFFSFSNMVAGFIAVMIGFTSSVALVFQAASSAGASPMEISSWVFGLGMSMALTCISLSLYYRMPILTGWSTPGAAMLALSLSGIPMAEVIGCFVFASSLTLLVGLSGVFEKLMKHIPKSLSAAMLAGILFKFGISIFTSMQEQLVLVGSMLVVYLIGKNLFPRYVIPLVLVVGVAIAQQQGLFHIDNFQLEFATPKFVWPVFSGSSLLSIGLPLFIVTMTSQNIPGAAVLQNADYNPPLSPVISWVGFINTLFAPFGAYSISLAAMTAAICTSEEADQDPKSRYRSTIFAGLCWFLIGLFGTTIVTVFYAFPKPLIMALAGLALLGTIGNSLKHALEDEKHREPALITMLVSASGITLFGMGAVFWGLIAGILSSMILNWRKKKLFIPAVNA